MLDHHSQQDKSKVTLYLTPDTHKQLRIRSAVEDTQMSVIAEKAISFYLAHQDIIERHGYGFTHQLHDCPKCAEKLVLRHGVLVSVADSHHHEPARDLVLASSTN